MYGCRHSRLFRFSAFYNVEKKFNEDATDKILLIGIFGTAFGIFAAVLFQSVYNFADALATNPKAEFKLEGMTFIGGLIGGVSSFCLCGMVTSIFWLRGQR